MKSLNTDKELLRLVRRAWEEGAPLRAMRRRLKSFAYGRQWEDATTTPDGRRLTEGQRAIEEGRTPISNNIIRRMIKSVIGHYSHLTATEQRPETEENPRVGFSPLCERDARALEELLISGCAIQYVDMATGDIENVSPDRFIFRRFERSDASDCCLMGVLRDLPLDEVLHRYSGRSARRATEIKDAYRHSDVHTSPFPMLSSASATDLTAASLPGTVRVIEVWQRRSVELLRVHDPLRAEYTVADISRSDTIERINRRRGRKGEPPLSASYDIARTWVCTLLTPEGLVLESYPAASHPFAVRFYPMIDGEVHSAVEDVVDQQKLINRLVSTLDQIIASSAKGVLLYPADQLPEGFTWKDVRRIWSNPSGILPFKRTSSSLMPHQVSSTGNSSGATELLRTQLQLFDEISGATSAFRSRLSSNSGEGMLRAELENALISMLDILNSFHEFICSRDKICGTISSIKTTTSSKTAKS